nr:MAG TPA: hypothetical protein [Caudoviricetes sp.]
MIDSDRLSTNEFYYSSFFSQDYSLLLFLYYLNFYVIIYYLYKI